MNKLKLIGATDGAARSVSARWMSWQKPPSRNFENVIGSCQESSASAVARKMFWQQNIYIVIEKVDNSPPLSFHRYVSYQAGSARKVLSAQATFNDIFYIFSSPSFHSRARERFREHRFWWSWGSRAVRSGSFPDSSLAFKGGRNVSKFIRVSSWIDCRI